MRQPIALTTLLALAGPASASMVELGDDLESPWHGMGHTTELLAGANQLLAGTGLSLGPTKYDCPFIAGETTCAVRMRVDGAALWADVEVRVAAQAEGKHAVLFASLWDARLSSGQIDALNALLAGSGIALGIAESGALRVDVDPFVRPVRMELANFSEGSPYFVVKAPNNEIIGSSEMYRAASTVELYDDELEHIVTDVTWSNVSSFQIEGLGFNSTGIVLGDEDDATLSRSSTYTGRDGVIVQLDDSIEGFERLVNGEFDGPDYPEAAGETLEAPAHAETQDQRRYSVEQD